MQPLRCRAANRTDSAGRAATGLLCLLLAAAPGVRGGTSADEDLELPPREEIEEHKSYDPAPELRQTPGGGLIVNAFILEGPVRVEIRDRDTDELVLEKQEDSLFPFEISRRDLGIEPTGVVVRIYVEDELAHELDLRSTR